jgi:hypothetical protein
VCDNTRFRSVICVVIHTYIRQAHGVRHTVPVWVPSTDAPVCIRERGPWGRGGSGGRCQTVGTHRMYYKLLFYYYESTKRKLKTKYICGCRCYERLQPNTKECTRLAYSELVLELEHLKINYVRDWLDFFFTKKTSIFFPRIGFRFYRGGAVARKSGRMGDAMEVVEDHAAAATSKGSAGEIAAGMWGVLCIRGH